MTGLGGGGGGGGGGKLSYQKLNKFNQYLFMFGSLLTQCCVSVSQCHFNRHVYIEFMNTCTMSCINENKSFYPIPCRG